MNGYLDSNKASEEALADAIKVLSECEKYMVAMLKVSRAAAKFDCMLFKEQFEDRLKDLRHAVETVQTACTQVKTSEKLRKVMGIILALVNHINTGGEGQLAHGFSLDALLKLNEVSVVDQTIFRGL